MKICISEIALAVVILFIPASTYAQQVGSTVKPPAAVTAPRQATSVGIGRVKSQDSVLSGGGTTATHNNLIKTSQVTFDVCKLDSKQAGCPGFCAANPTAAVCK